MKIVYKIALLLILSITFLYAETIEENADDMCYMPMESSGTFCMDIGPCEGGMGCKKLYPLKNISSETLTDVEVDYDETGLGGTFGDSCGVEDDDGSAGTCETQSNIDMGPVGILGSTTHYDLDNDIASGDDQNKVWAKNFMSGSCFNGSNLYATYYKNGVKHRGQVKPCLISYCEEHNLDEGFNVIDPDGGDDDNSFEIFCHQENGIWHDLIALPIKNNSNNFLFDNADTELNYYNEDDNPRTHFQAIEINGGRIKYDGTQPQIPVVTARADEPWEITTDRHDYNVLGSKFSNINLIGTPFKIDWDKTTLEDCNATALRKALGQAVKYNTLIDDGESRCKIKNMSLTLLDDYRFLVYDDEEVLQHSCKEMAAYVPDNIGVLDDEDIAGHFNILTSEPAYPNSTPTTNGEREHSTDIGDAKKRPLTVYCKYQQDLEYVWTFLTALDGTVTNSKNDITNGEDTCSQLGLWFFVPNSKETFNRVRLYLKNQKSGDSGWENYTGTVREKYKMYRNNQNQEYYLTHLGYEEIWPYGPLGIYYPCNGNHDSKDSCSDRRWYPGHTDEKGWMSGSPMHNIKTMSNYSDSMGKKGWVSILGSQDLNKTDDWWVADIGAGEEVGNSTPQYSPHGSHRIQSEGFKYYEPNGNYTKNAWLNFLHDDEGWIYHNDDNNAFYAYYDYMCMSETNYDFANRYALIPGFFNAIERGTRSGNSDPEFSDTNITTKIVSKNTQLDILLYKINTDGTIDRSHLNTDENKSVGVFVSYIKDSDAPKPIKYLGTYSDFSGNNGRIEMDDFNISSAHKRNIVQFYYCNSANRDWTECWEYSTGNDGSITLRSLNNDSGRTDSLDDFAIRPKKFGIVASSTNAVRAENVSINYYAYNEANQPSANYNESFANLDFNTTLADPSKASICPNTTLTLNADKFVDGIETNSTKFSNVGIWNIQIKERNGSEFAYIDNDDTPDAQRFITPADINLTIIPAYFDVSLKANINSGTNFTYISNDLDHMGIEFDMNVTAKNSDGAVTPNFSVGCYPDNINIDLNYSIVSSATNPAAFGTTTLIRYKEINANVDGNNTATNNTLSLPHGTDVLPGSLFTATSRGTAPIKLRINFKREKNIALNPFKVHFTDVNVSDQVYTPVIASNTASHAIDRNATMIYGRTNAPRQRISGQNGNVNIYYESFCDGVDTHGTKCNKAILPNGTISKFSDDPRWYINTLHKLANGTAGTASQKSHPAHISQTGNVTNTSPARALLHYDGLRGYPYKATMENNASGWLIYNKYDASKTKNEFEVEFTENNASWAGKHETDTSTKRNATNKTNRRTMW